MVVLHTGSGTRWPQRPLLPQAFLGLRTQAKKTGKHSREEAGIPRQACLSVHESREQDTNKGADERLHLEPMCFFQPSPTMDSVSSSDTACLLKLNCPRPVRQQDQQRPWQRFSSAPAKSGTANTSDCGRYFGKKTATRDWLTQTDFCGVKAAPDESRDIVASVQRILDRERYFVREVDRYLQHNDFLNLRKKEMLHKKWLEDVSEPLLQKIEDKMNSQSSEEIRKRKEEQFSLYLSYCKKKGHVALDAYDPSEYDPFFLKTHTDCWKVSLPALQDPLLEGIQRQLLETGVIRQCETGRPCSTRELKELGKAELPLLPLSRQRTDAVEWLKVPHAYIASEVHQRTRRKVIIHRKDSKSQWCPLSSS